MKKIVFFDIDGTLLDHEKKLPISTKEAIFKLKEKGIYVAIATGRAPFMFHDLKKELEIETYVSLNGQYVVFEGEVVHHQPFSKKDLQRLLYLSEQLAHPLVFLNDEKMEANVESHTFVEESLKSLGFPHPKKTNILEMNNVYQALVFCEEREEEEYKKRLNDFNFLRWHKYSVDVLPLAGSKAFGIQQIIRKLNFSIKDVYAFGDGLNDMEMLKTVGVGVAMGNAKEEVKKHADLITKNVDEDGIYYGLKELKLI